MNHEELIEQAGIKLCPIGRDLIQEEHPVSESRAGRNIVFHNCEIYQGRPSYAACLTVMDQAFEGRNRELRPQCHEAIEAGTCPALAMRKAELAAGRALFYVDYVELSARRQVQWAADLEASPIQFRRKRGDRKFVPTEVKVLGAEEIRAQRKPTPAVESSEADDYNTNIMEQVVKKVLNDQ